MSRNAVKPLPRTKSIQGGIVENRSVAGAELSAFSTFSPADASGLDDRSDEDINGREEARPVEGGDERAGDSETAVGDGPEPRLEGGLGLRVSAQARAASVASLPNACRCETGDGR